MDGDTFKWAGLVCVPPVTFIIMCSSEATMYIVLYFFNGKFGYVFFVLGPAEDLGGAVGAEIDCVVYCVAVETTGGML